MGTYCHALAAAFGLSQLFVAVPMAYDAVRYAGAAYLLFLAWQTFRSDGIIAMPTGEALHYSPSVMLPAGVDHKSSEPENGAIRIGPLPAVCKTRSRFGRRTDDDPCDRAQHHWSCRKRCRHSRRKQAQSPHSPDTTSITAFLKFCLEQCLPVLRSGLRLMSAGSSTTFRNGSKAPRETY